MSNFENSGPAFPSNRDIRYEQEFEHKGGTTLRQYAAVKMEAAYRVMVDRFLSWKLPQDFGPDAGISFTPPPHLPDLYWPTGTNLFHAGQALEMFKHCVELPSAVAVRLAEKNLFDAQEAAKIITKQAIAAEAERDALAAKLKDAEHDRDELRRVMNGFAELEGQKPVAGAGGMTLRQYAAIKLRVPNSGADWLDEMIRTSLRDELAAKAMPACYADYCKHADVQGYVEGWRVGVAKDAYESADAILVARAANPGPEPEIPYSRAAVDVLAERARQVEAEGWTPEHDDKHKNGSMALAAACYAMSGSTLNDRTCSETVGALWPWTGWAWTWWKPSTPRRDLVKATSLLLAEIERIDRAEARRLETFRSKSK